MNDWSDKDIEILKKEYFSCNINLLATKLNRTFYAVKVKANRLGLKRESTKISKNCLVCFKHFFTCKSASKREFCSKICKGRFFSGKNSPNFIDGLTETASGYKLIYTQTSKRKREHRVIAETILKRPLKSHEVVHHINLNKSDNRNCNLLICDRNYHAWLHQEMSRRWAMEHIKNE